MSNRSSIAFVAVLAGSGALRGQDATLRLSNLPSGDAAGGGFAVISADGRFVAFVGGAIASDDTNGVADVYVVEGATGAVERVSVASDGSQGNFGSGNPCLSADGRFVAFESFATNLTADAVTGKGDVFVRDRVAGTTTLASCNAAGEPADDFALHPSISADGSRIAFHSPARNLAVPAERDRDYDVFVRDLVAGATIHVSVNQDRSRGNDHSYFGHVSGDGLHVAFSSNATNFPDWQPGPFAPGSWIKDLETGHLERLDFDEAGVPGTSGSYVDAVSEAGSLVALQSWAALVPDDENGVLDVYVRDRATATTTRASVTSAGHEIAAGGFHASMSGDGRFVVFASSGATEDDRNGEPFDVYVRDRHHGVTMLVSRGTLDETLPGGAWLPDGGGSAVALDGRRIVFSSNDDANLSGDGNGLEDVFLRERSLLPASSQHYGAGFPGRGGVVPELTIDGEPWRGAARTFALGNSSGLHTVGFLLVGVARDALVTRLGGTLLVSPLVALPQPIAAVGSTLHATLPTDAWANGLVLDLQLLELDPFAAKGVSFSDGLELTLGDG